MNNIEKRLQEKVRREEAAEKRKEERKSIRIKKKIQRGTKKIYYTILKKAIKNKEEDISICFNEFLEFSTSLPCLGGIKINGERVFLGKTYFDLEKLEEYLKVFDFSMTRNDHYYYSSVNDLIIQEQLLFLYGPIRMKSHELTATRSQVCQRLLTLPPQNQQANPSLNSGGPTLTIK